MDKPMSKIASFGACLLMVGPPDALGSTSQKDPPEHTVRSIQRWRGNDEPVSSMAYMVKCSDWYNENFQALAVTYRANAEFTKWWSEYKRWLLSSDHG